MTSTKGLFVVSLLVCLTVGETATAGGLYLPVHGVRALGRGGAFVAGGDDPGGIWHNPANIGGLPGWQVLVDGSLIFLQMDYQRVDSGGRLHDTVSNAGPLLPIPTIALTRSFWDRRLTLGFSITAPYAAMPGYPEPKYNACSSGQTSGCLGAAHSEAPQRYSIVSMDGSIILQADLVVAFAVIPQLTVGVSMQNLFVNFSAQTVITTYNGVLGTPEDPEFDAVSRMEMPDYFNPSAAVGLVAEPIEGLRLGLSVKLPVKLSHSAKVQVQMPVSPLYSGSRIEGDEAQLEMTFPMAVRGGIEVQPIDNLKVEIGFDWEQWSVLDAIRVQPTNINMYDIPGMDSYVVPEISVWLNFRDAIAARVGGEYTFDDLPLVVRAGYMFERGSVADEHATVLAWDNHKHMLSLGASYTLWGYRLDLAYAHFFINTRTVSYKESQAKQVNPIEPKYAASVGGGTYEGAVDVLGVGVTRSF